MYHALNCYSWNQLTWRRIVRSLSWLHKGNKIVVHDTPIRSKRSLYELKVLMFTSSFGNMCNLFMLISICCLLTVEYTKKQQEGI